MKMAFDENALIKDVIIVVNQELDGVAEVLVELMIGEVAKMPNYNEEFTQWKLDVIEALHWRAVAVSSELVREVGVLDQSAPTLYKAFAVNFGTGEKMDSTNNPWYQEYLSSEYYHTSRQGNGIYSLPGEEVYDPNTNAWYQSTATSRKPLPFFEEKGAEFWTNIFGNSAIIAETYFNDAIERAMEQIDFSKYLIVKE